MISSTVSIMASFQTQLLLMVMKLMLMFLGVFEPTNKFKGKCIAIIHRTNDDDDKLVVVPDGSNYSDNQIRALTEFQERFFESEIILG